MGGHIRKGSCIGLENLGIKLELEKNDLAYCRNAELRSARRFTGQDIRHPHRRGTGNHRGRLCLDERNI
jgi:hypothetical protein